MGTTSITVSDDPIGQQVADPGRLDEVVKAADKAFAPIRDPKAFGFQVRATIGYWVADGKYLPTAAVRIVSASGRNDLLHLRERPFGDGTVTRIEISDSEGLPMGMTARDWDTAFDVVCPRI